MVARTRRTNSVAHSMHAGEPFVRAPGDEASASTSRHHAGSTFSSKGTRVSELQEMLANLTDLVTDLTAQQAVILRQTQQVCTAVLPPLPVAAARELLLPVAASPAPPLPVAVAPVLPPHVVEVPAPLPPITVHSVQSSGSSQLLRCLPAQGAHQNHFLSRPLPQPAFLPPTFPPFLAGRDHLFPGAQAPHYGPDPFFGPMDSNAPFADAIRLALIPEDFRPPRLKAYKGATDPCEHIQ
ncbi:hypothetical protein AXF42_Ash015052 [Apostasia shenzhenica]|uniref:Uncharacterized protein n=1 Tax=Apostasia shenzhenica TaxID=1088818 RepID=A0A2I0B2Z0_9ASPA|nr:hypothetical protein AXF42_Ash015052 [Apostasia shenzhenica]